jgi:hypothetical protein
MEHRRAGSRHLGGAHPRQRAFRRNGLMALAALALCLVGAALGAAYTTRIAAQPVKQLSDRLEGPGQQELAGLFVTVLEGEVTEISWGEKSLPCPGHSYRLLSTEAAISTAYSSFSHVQIAIESEHLTRGLRCGSTLPQDVQEGDTSVSVRSVDPGTQVGSPANIYEDGETQIKSFSPCVTLSRICTGRYVLRAYLDGPRRHVQLEYVFAVLSGDKASDPPPPS